MACYSSDLASRLRLTQDQDGKLLDDRNLDHVNYPYLKLCSSLPVDSYHYVWEPIDHDGERSYSLMNPRLDNKFRRDYSGISHIFDTEVATTAEVSTTPILETVSPSLAEEHDALVSDTTNTSSSFQSFSNGSCSIARPASRNAVVRGSGSYDIVNFHQEHADKQSQPFNRADPFDLIVGEDGIIRFVCEVTQELEKVEERTAASPTGSTLQSLPSYCLSSTLGATIPHPASTFSVQGANYNLVEALQQECATKPYLPFNQDDPFNLTIGEDGVIRFVHEEELSPTISVFDNDGEPPSDHDSETSPSSNNESNGAGEKTQDNSDAHDDHVAQDEVFNATSPSKQQYTPSVLEIVAASPPGEDVEASAELKPSTASVSGSEFQFLCVDDKQVVDGDGLGDLEYGDVSALQAELLKSCDSSEEIQQDLTDVLDAVVDPMAAEDLEECNVSTLQAELFMTYTSADQIQRDLSDILDTFADHTIVEDFCEEEEGTDDEAVENAENCNVSALQAELLKAYTSSEEIQRDLTSVLDTLTYDTTIEDLEDYDVPILQAELFMAYPSSEQIQRDLTVILSTFATDTTFEDVDDEEVAVNEASEDLEDRDISALQAELLLAYTTSDEIQRDLTSVLDTFTCDTTIEDPEDLSVSILQAELLRAYTSSEEIQRDLTDILSTFANNTVVEEASDDERIEDLEDCDISALHAELFSAYTSSEEIQRDLSDILDTFNYPATIDEIENDSITALQAELLRGYTSSDKIHTDLADILETFANHVAVEDTDDEEMTGNETTENSEDFDILTLQAELFRAYTSSEDIQRDLFDTLDTFAQTTSVYGDDEEEVDEQVAEEFETSDISALQAELLRAYTSSTEVQGHLPDVPNTFGNNATVDDLDEEAVSDEQTAEHLEDSDASTLQAELLRAHISHEDILGDLCDILNIYAYHATVEEVEDEEVAIDKTQAAFELCGNLAPENDILGSFGSLEQYQEDSLAAPDTELSDVPEVATDNKRAIGAGREQLLVGDSHISQNDSEALNHLAAPRDIANTYEDFDISSNLAQGTAAEAMVSPSTSVLTANGDLYESSSCSYHILDDPAVIVVHTPEALDGLDNKDETDEKEHFEQLIVNLRATTPTNVDTSFLDAPPSYRESLLQDLQERRKTSTWYGDHDIFLDPAIILVDKLQSVERWEEDEVPQAAAAHFAGLLHGRAGSAQDNHTLSQPIEEDETLVPQVESPGQAKISDAQEDIAEPSSFNAIEDDKDDKVSFSNLLLGFRQSATSQHLPNLSEVNEESAATLKVVSASKFTNIGFPGLKTDLQIEEFFGAGQDGAATKAHFAALLRKIRRTTTDSKPSRRQFRSTKVKIAPREPYFDSFTNSYERRETTSCEMPTNEKGEPVLAQSQVIFRFGSLTAPPFSWLFGRKDSDKYQTTYQQVKVTIPASQTNRKSSESSTTTSIFFSGNTSSDSSSRNSSLTDVDSDGGNVYQKVFQETSGDQIFVSSLDQASETTPQQTPERSLSSSTDVFSSTKISPALSTTSSKFRVFSPEPIAYRGRLRRQRKWSNLRNIQTDAQLTNNPFNNIFRQKVDTAIDIDLVRTTQNNKSTEPSTSNGVSGTKADAAFMLQETSAEAQINGSPLPSRLSKIPATSSPVSKKKALQPGSVLNNHREQSPASIDGTPSYAKHTLSSMAKMVGLQRRKQHPRVTSLRSNPSVPEDWPTVTKERESMGPRPITPSPTLFNQGISPLQQITSPQAQILQNSTHSITESEQGQDLPILQPTKRVIPPLPPPIQRPRPVIQRPLPATPDLANRPRTRPCPFVEPIPEKISYVIPWQVPLYAPVAQQPGHHHARIVAEMASLEDDSIYRRPDLGYGSKMVENLEETVQEN